jgi:hypothetical protein
VSALVLPRVGKGATCGAPAKAGRVEVAGVSHSLALNLLAMNGKSKASKGSRRPLPREMDGDVTLMT